MPLSQEERIELKRFGANIRRERVAKSLTQEKLAELVDLNVRTVQKIEAGSVNILITTVFRFQRALKCPWNRVLKEEK
ncbi:MAG: helix-turn-helix transcriptional regulator [Verrucomicrobia bacterium]|nr:helix-turn-helix transcriptional regulator [Verrucomicrobiota bacterium]